MTKKLILFDFDGTIADTLSFGISTYNNHAHNYGLKKIESQDILRLKGKTAPEIFKVLQIPFYKMPFLYNTIQSEMKKSIDTLTIFPSIKEVINDLKKSGYNLGIITSTREETIKIFLKTNNLEVFDFIHTERNIFGKDKVIRNVLHSHDLMAEEVIYIGDEVRDIQACQKVGVEIISVTWGFNTKTLLEKYNPTYIINSPKELLKILS